MALYLPFVWDATNNIFVRMPSGSYVNPTALGSGTANSGSLLCGDSAYRTPPGTMDYFHQVGTSPTKVGYVTPHGVSTSNAVQTANQQVAVLFNSGVGGTVVEMGVRAAG